MHAQWIGYFQSRHSEKLRLLVLLLKQKGDVNKYLDVQVMEQVITNMYMNIRSEIVFSDTQSFHTPNATAPRHQIISYLKSYDTIPHYIMYDTVLYHFDIDFISFIMTCF